MRIGSIFSVVLILCLSTTVVAEDWFFDGDVNDDWNNPLNWDPDTLPTIPGDGLGGVEIGAFPGVLNATVNITGPLTEPVIGDLRVGSDDFGGANAILNHSVGSLSTKNESWAFVGLDGPEGFPNVGTYNLSGTAIFDNTDGVDQQFHIGIGGGPNAGNEGFVTVSDNAALNLNRVFVGSNDNNFGTLTQTGGSVNVNDWLTIGRDGGATGTYNMSGGTLFVGNDYLTVGENTGATGMMNVSGDASIETANLGVGRFGGGAQGTLTITGPDASISTLGMVVGRNDQDSFNPADATGTLRFSSTSDVSPIEALGEVYLNDGSVIGGSFLEVDLTGSTVTGDVLLVSVGLNLDGTFSGLPEGASVPDSGGRTITYMGGDGNDIVLLAGGGGVDGDFNNDGRWDCMDIDALVGAVASGSTDLSFDMNGDGVINADDITDSGDGWLAVGGASTPGTPSGNPFLLGDATLDGTVDGLDFIEWNNNKFTNLAEWCGGDFNADGIVGGLDFIEWNNNKFTSSDHIASVPEPAALTLWLSALTVIVVRRRLPRP